MTVIPNLEFVKKKKKSSTLISEKMQQKNRYFCQKVSFMSLSHPSFSLLIPQLLPHSSEKMRQSSFLLVAKACFFTFSKIKKKVFIGAPESTREEMFRMNSSYAILVRVLQTSRTSTMSRKRLIIRYCVMCLWWLRSLVISILSWRPRKAGGAFRKPECEWGRFQFESEGLRIRIFS